jgi:hypothetical protein
MVFFIRRSSIYLGSYLMMKYLIGEGQDIPGKWTEPCDNLVRLDREVRMLVWVDSIWRLRGVRREQISPKNLNGTAARYRRKASQVDRDLPLTGGLAIQHEKDDPSLIGVVNR